MTQDHVFLDTNVLLDYFLAREPQGSFAAQILHLAAVGKVKASTSAVSFSNVAYLLGRLDRTRIVERDLQELLQFVKIIPNTAGMLGDALEMPLPDYEDAIQYVSALQGSCSHLVTSNKKHFKKCSIPILEPSEYMKAGGRRSSSGMGNYI